MTNMSLCTLKAMLPVCLPVLIQPSPVAPNQENGSERNSQGPSEHTNAGNHHCRYMRIRECLEAQVLSHEMGAIHHRLAVHIKSSQQRLRNFEVHKENKNNDCGNHQIHNPCVFCCEPLQFTSPKRTAQLRCSGFGVLLAVVIGSAPLGTLLGGFRGSRRL